MEKNLQRLGVRSENDELSDATVESLGGYTMGKERQLNAPLARSGNRRTFVCALLELLELRGTLYEVQNLTMCF